MKLFFFIGNLANSGGTERVLSIIGSGLARRGHDVTLVSLTGKAPTFFSFDERVKIVWLGSEGLQTNIGRNLKRLIGLVRREKPDCWIDVDYILGVYSIFLKMARPKMKWISWEHFNFVFPFDINAGLRKLIRPVVALCADGMVVLSDEDKALYQQHVHVRGPLTRIHNPLPYEDVAPPEKREKIVLAAGRLTYIKGYDMLIDIWAKVEPKHPDWQLIVAGSGEEEAALKDKLAQTGLKNMHLIGRVNDIQSYYRRASTFVLTSRNEGFVMVLLESMAYGLPAVAFRCQCGVGEAILDGETGFLAAPGDLDAYAAHLDRLLTDDELRETMGEAARLSSTRFTREKILDQWEELLHRLCG